MSHNSDVAPFRCVYANELPAEWKRPFAPKPDQLRSIAEQLHIRTDQVRVYVVFSGPQCKLSLDYVRFLEANNAVPGGQHVGTCIENAQTWAAGRPPTALAEWARHFKAHGFPPLTSLAQAIHGEQQGQGPAGSS